MEAFAYLIKLLVGLFVAIVLFLAIAIGVIVYDRIHIKQLQTQIVTLQTSNLSNLSTNTSK